MCKHHEMCKPDPIEWTGESEPDAEDEDEL
jgi:hypothetical protein